MQNEEQETTEYETITVRLSLELKRKLEEYNFYNKKNKINKSEVCRNALKEELKKRGVDVDD